MNTANFYEIARPAKPARMPERALSPPEPTDEQLAREDWETSNEIIALIGHEAANEALILLADGDLNGASDRLDKAFKMAWAKLQQKSGWM